MIEIKDVKNTENTITCCLCDQTVPLTDDCKKLFDKDICPACCERLSKIADKYMKAGMEGDADDNSDDTSRSMDVN